MILKVTDSFGNVFHRSQLEGVHDGGIMKSFYDDSQYFLRVGDTLTLEVEVDPSFNVDNYSISWSSAKGLNSIQSGKKLVLQITENHVAQQFDIQCRVVTNKGWHRMHMGADDFMIFYYKVLPPI